MAVNSASSFSSAFGKKAAAAPAAGEPRVKSEFWLNIGLPTGKINENTGEEWFVALPFGIPLDTMEMKKTSMNSQELAMFNAACNGLYDQIMAKAKTLQPGESVIIGGSEDGLQIQLRRNKGEQVLDTSVPNPFATVLSKL